MKYPHVKIVAKRTCSACDGTGKGDAWCADPDCADPQHRKPCPSCHGKGEAETELLHPGEPFFLVRGQDELAPTVVGIYGVLVDRNGGDASGLDDLAERMREFHEANPALVKAAD